MINMIENRLSAVAMMKVNLKRIEEKAKRFIKKEDI